MFVRSCCFQGSFRSHAGIREQTPSSGRSLLASLAALTASFPHADFFATALFRSRGNGYSADREDIPWLAIPGMAGILESADSDLVSIRISQEEVDRVRAEIRRKIPKSMEVPLQRMETFDASRQAFFEFLDSLGSAFHPVLVAELKRDTNAMFSMIRPVIESGVPDGFPSSVFFETLCHWRQVRRIFIDFLEGSERSEFEKLAGALDDAVPTNDSEFGDALNLVHKLGPETGYVSAEVLRARARQLRRELKQLAKEPSR